MKRIILTILCCVTALFAAGRNASAQALPGDEICGDWVTSHGGGTSYVKVSKSADGTYKAQVWYVSQDKDKNGNKILDTKNPDKSLRNTPIDKVVLFSGLKYDAGGKCWNVTKIYDPSRGLKANLTCRLNGNEMSLRGQVMGIGETVVWKRK